MSQYQAEVCTSSFQKVVLSTNPPVHPRLQQSSSSPKFLNIEHHRRTISLSDDLKLDDSSPEELSFQGDDFADDDMHVTENKAVNGNSRDCFGVNRNRFLTSASNECIPEYSASEESRNVRNFQLITLPDGKTREIDMKVSISII